MSSFNHCFVDAKRSLSLFNDDELKIYAARVIETAKNYSDLKGNEAIQRAIEEVGEIKGKELTEELQVKINNSSKIDILADGIKNKKFNVRDFVAKIHKNLAYNIESAQRSARKILNDSLFRQFTNEEHRYLMNKDAGDEVTRAMDGDKNVSDIAKSIAKKVEDYRLIRNTHMVASDALLLSAINEDRFLRAVHTPQLLMNGGLRGAEAAVNMLKSTVKNLDVNEVKRAWKEFIKPHLNLEKTFRGTSAIDVDGRLNMTEVDNLLDKIFDNITTEKPEMFNTGIGNSHMFFYWKDNNSMYRYAQRYGKKDLYAMLMADVNQSGNRIGMSEIFGTKPTETFNHLVKIENEANPVKKKISFRTLNTFNYLAGIDQSPISPTLANFGSTLRSLTSMKALGRVALVSLPDIANGVSFAKRWGFDYWESYTTHLTGLFNLLPSEERKFIAESFKEMTDHHMGYVSRFVDANNIPAAINTANTYFYRTIGLEALDKGNKVSALYILSKNLGRMGNLEWEGLPELTKKQMSKFDFTKAEWEALRRKSEKGLFTMDNVNKLSNEEIRNIYGATPDQPLHLLKSNLYRKVYSMFDVWADNSVLQPGAYMRSMTMGGTRAGTITGEIWRTILQFKQYAINYLDKVLYQGFKDAEGSQAKLGYMMLLMGTTAPMGFLSYYLNNLAQGKSLPSWDQMDWGERTEAALEITFPANGLFNTFLRGQNQGSSLIVNTFNTPAIRELSNGLSSVVALTKGDFKKFQKGVKATAFGITPGVSVPFLDPYFRAALGQKAYLQPGQTQLYGK